MFTSLFLQAYNQIVGQIDVLEQFGVPQSGSLLVKLIGRGGDSTRIDIPCRNL